jgi:hypothetical protein
MQTAAQATFQISDLPGPTGGVLLKIASGAMIAINDVGITITNEKAPPSLSMARRSPSTMGH